jgi:hypothetical protein
MIKKFRAIVYVMIFCIIIIAFSGCIQPSTKVTLIEYSNRIDGSRDIRVYQNENASMRLTVVRNMEPKDVSVKGLTNEIKYLVSNLRDNSFEKSLQPYNLDGHTAISTSTIWMTEGGVTTGIPNEYITAIAYPEHNMIMTFRTKAEGSTQDDHFNEVKKYKI